MIDRPHNPIHSNWKPGGFVGHGAGIIGSVLMLVLFLYSARKRFRFMRKWGNIRYWLNYHIWMGVSGPILVIFHSTFKVHGIIAISFWSMVAVALSGVLGRYIYLQIPRSLSGEELSGRDMQDVQDDLHADLNRFSGLKDRMFETISMIIGKHDISQSTKLAALFNWLLSDLALPFRMIKLRGVLRNSPEITKYQTREIIVTVRKLAILKRRIVFLQQAQAILHYWHIIHKPFAYVMIIIMIIHVIISIVFGYKWIF
ncbi:MAG: hypothetical protein HN757_06750 [Calditrichaeota bacterium]|nr:hypothetical protein [Calditrichota bacterium]